MDEHEGLGLGGDGLFECFEIEVEGFFVHIDEDRCQTGFRDSQDGSDEGIGRNEDFISLLQTSHLLIGLQREGQGIQAVRHTHTILRTDILGIVLFEPVQSLTLQVPSATYHLCHCLLYLFLMQGCHAFQIKIRYRHTSHS